MPILIDGHNLIGRLTTLSLQDPDDEEKLVRLLKSYRARTGKAITVVFDAGWTSALSKSHRLGGIEVVFAPNGSSADAVIARRVRRSRDPRAWLVVTSDRELAGTVASLGARVQSADAFALAMPRPTQESPEWKDTPPTPEDVEAWLDVFEGQE